MTVPSYNVQTGEIKDCSYGSLAWWHEERHRQQMELFPFAKYFFSYNCFLLFSSMAFVFTFFYLDFAKILLAFLFVVPIAFELDAWVWSLWKKKNFFLTK
jgi:hypothetical protein